MALCHGTEMKHGRKIGSSRKLQAKGILPVLGGPRTSIGLSRWQVVDSRQGVAIHICDCEYCSCGRRRSVDAQISQCMSIAYETPGFETRFAHWAVQPGQQSTTIMSQYYALHALVHSSIHVCLAGTADCDWTDGIETQSPGFLTLLEASRGRLALLGKFIRASTIVYLIPRSV